IRIRCGTGFRHGTQRTIPIRTRLFASNYFEDRLSVDDAFPIGKPPRPRYERMLCGILLIARPPLLALMQGGECARFRFVLPVTKILSKAWKSSYHVYVFYGFNPTGQPIRSKNRRRTHVAGVPIFILHFEPRLM